MYAAGQAIAIRQARKHVKKQGSGGGAGEPAARGLPPTGTHAAVRAAPGSGERFPRYPKQLHHHPAQHHGGEHHPHGLRPPHANGKVSWQNVPAESARGTSARRRSRDPRPAGRRPARRSWPARCLLPWPPAAPGNRRSRWPGAREETPPDGLSSGGRRRRKRRRRPPPRPAGKATAVSRSWRRREARKTRRRRGVFSLSVRRRRRRGRRLVAPRPPFPHDLHRGEHAGSASHTGEAEAEAEEAAGQERTSEQRCNTGDRALPAIPTPDLGESSMAGAEGGHGSSVPGPGANCCSQKAKQSPPHPAITHRCGSQPQMQSFRGPPPVDEEKPDTRCFLWGIQLLWGLQGRWSSLCTSLRGTWYCGCGSSHLFRRIRREGFQDSRVAYDRSWTYSGWSTFVPPKDIPLYLLSTPFTPSPMLPPQTLSSLATTGLRKGPTKLSQGGERRRGGSNVPLWFRRGQTSEGDTKESLPRSTPNHHHVFLTGFVWQWTWFEAKASREARSIASHSSGPTHRPSGSRSYFVHPSGASATKWSDTVTKPSARGG